MANDMGQLFKRVELWECNKTVHIWQKLFCRIYPTKVFQTIVFTGIVFRIFEFPRDTDAAPVTLYCSIFYSHISQNSNTHRILFLLFSQTSVEH
jgi:hypothetical protein